MTNLLEIMSEDDRARMLERYRKRVAPSEKKNKISNEMFMLADFGLMYGWQAILDVRENKITSEEMFALLEAGHKVQSTHELDDGIMTQTAISSALAKDKSHAQRTFNQGMRKHLERVE